MRTCAALAVASLLFASAPSAARAQEGKRYALVVGVNEYEHEKLKALEYAVNDAAELGAILEKSGYLVTELTDTAGKKDPKLAPTKANIEKHLRAVLGGAKKGDLVLVALAGHGLQFEGDRDAYFCPSDAKPLKSKADSLVSLKGVYEELDGSFAGMKVLLVDACRDDPSRSRGVGADTAPRPPQGVAALFSCKAGQRAFESAKYKHGIFFHHVLAGLRGEAADKRGRVTFAGLAAHVGQEVPNDVSVLVGNGAVQTPNLKAEYASEPVLVAKVVAPLHSSAPDDLVLAELRADLRAYERAFAKGGQLTPFLEREAPKKLAGWRKSAQNGVPQAQILFAACLYRGIGVEQNHKEAFRLFKKNAEGGFPIAMLEVSDMFGYGYGVERSTKEYLRWLTNAANAGSPVAMTRLGSIYYFGGALAQDQKEGVRWFLKAAEAGDPVGMGYLGPAYALGQGVEQDEQESLRWYTKAAEAGNTTAMCGLANKYHFGSGAGAKAVPQNIPNAVKWYTRAAEEGDVSGMDSLARIYETGYGVLKDEKTAAEWYQKSAEAGSTVGMFGLGRMYEDGRGVRKDEKQAVDWYRKAAARNHLEAKDALKRLGKE